MNIRKRAPIIAFPRKAADSSLSSSEPANLINTFLGRLSCEIHFFNSLLLSTARNFFPVEGSIDVFALILKILKPSSLSIVETLEFGVLVTKFDNGTAPSLVGILN